jgi:hypothetical protein
MTVCDNGKIRAQQRTPIADDAESHRHQDFFWITYHKQIRGNNNE